MVLQNAYIKVEMLIQKQFKHIVFNIKPQQSTEQLDTGLFIRKRYIFIVNSENFRENFIFVDSIKRHICDFKHSQLEHDLPILVNVRIFLLFREVSFSRNFAYAKFSENKNLAKISNLTVFIKI